MPGNRRLVVPDALALAFQHLNIGAVLKLVQFWKAPPACLLGMMVLGKDLYKDTNRKRYIRFAQHLLQLFGCPNWFCFERSQFSKYIAPKSVCSLQQIAVYKVRASCRVEGADLPKALGRLVPPALRNILLLKVSDREFDQVVDSITMDVKKEL
jgi:hypothetical protein